jgi:hypothetical protein
MFFYYHSSTGHPIFTKENTSSHQLQSTQSSQAVTHVDTNPTKQEENQPSQEQSTVWNTDPPAFSSWFGNPNTYENLPDRQIIMIQMTQNKKCNITFHYTNPLFSQQMV